MVTSIYIKILILIINIAVSGSFFGNFIDKPTVYIEPTSNFVYIDTDGTGNYNCNGINDNVEINKALEYVNDIGGGTVYLRGPNTYWISETLEIGPNTILEGDKNAIIKLIPYANWDVDVPLIKNKIDYTSNYTIHGFTIDGNSEYQPVDHGIGYYDLIYFYKCTNISVTNMNLQWAKGDGLKVRNYDHSNYTNILFANNSVYKLGHEALYALGLNGVIARDNTVFTRANSAFRLSSSGHAKIYNNVVHSEIAGWSTGPGIEVDKSANYPVEDVEIYNNLVYNLNGAGIYVIGEKDDKTPGQNVHIHHNILYDVGQYWKNTGFSNSGIVIGQFNNTTIENNVIHNTGTAAIKYYPRPEHEKMDDKFTTIVRNNILFGPNDRNSTGIWNTDPNNHTFITNNNCIYNFDQRYDGKRILDNDNIYVNPLFADEKKHDYHLQSTAGRWLNGKWIKDQKSSSLIDAGYLQSNYSLEPQPNGGRINIGRYGNTAEASKSNP